MSSDNSTNNSTKQQHPRARLCHVTKWDNFDGYGFNLHAEKGKPGQYIGKVDEGSPAEAAGLRQGDRILEVNGASIVGETHKQVVQRIKTLPNETKLLVIDPEDEAREHVANNGNGAPAETPSPKSTTPEPAVKPSPTPSPTSTNSNSSNANITTTPVVVAASDEPPAAHHEDAAVNNTNSGGLNLRMTAAELRAKLAAKKKYDPKKESLDFKKKFDIVQKL